MFGFFRSKTPAPPLCPSNPGIGPEAKIAVSGPRRWTENIDAVSLAASVFQKHGHSVNKEKSWLVHTASGFLITPQFLGVQPLEGGGVQTVTTIQANHATLCPAGLFEYQHSAGETAAESITMGFDQWLQTDFVTLLDALNPKPGACMALQMEFPAKDGKPARVRRAVLGPVAHMMQSPPPSDNASEEHPFCPCCLFTNSFEAFKELLEGDEFYGLRLYAAREPDGAPQADCRVNGDDWERGAEALRTYAQTWPPAGYEFRKQYVILQTLPAEAGRAAAS